MLSGKNLSQKAVEFIVQTPVNPQLSQLNLDKNPTSNNNIEAKTFDTNKNKSFEIQQNNDAKNDRKPKKIRLIFFLFLFTNLFINFDTGVIPASLIQIEKELNIDFTQQAALGIP